MPLDSHSIAGSHYGFSGTRIDDLGAAEYTLVAVAADSSPSVTAFKEDIERCVQRIAKACRHSPRADNLMMRIASFDHQVNEIHGFKPLSDCHPDSYDGAIVIGNATALYDAAHNAIESVARYGEHLCDNDFDVNGIVFVITDGEDNASRLKPKDINKALSKVIRSENLDSLVSILVGVNIRATHMSKYLNKLHRDGGFTHYVELDSADESTLAKLSDFVSRSISAQSRALGSGKSASLSF